MASTYSATHQLTLKIVTIFLLCLTFKFNFCNDKVYEKVDYLPGLNAEVWDQNQKVISITQEICFFFDIINIRTTG